MPYKPTGKPPGRPRADGLPAGSAKPVEVPEPVVTVAMRSPFDARPPCGTICPQCFPHLAGSGQWTKERCKHGIWINTL